MDGIWENIKSLFGHDTESKLTANDPVDLKQNRLTPIPSSETHFESAPKRLDSDLIISSLSDDSRRIQNYTRPQSVIPERFHGSSSADLVNVIVHGLIPNAQLRGRFPNYGGENDPGIITGAVNHDGISAVGSFHLEGALEYAREQRIRNWTPTIGIKQKENAEKAAAILVEENNDKYPNGKKTPQFSLIEKRLALTESRLCNWNNLTPLERNLIQFPFGVVYGFTKADERSVRSSISGEVGVIGGVPADNIIIYTASSHVAEVEQIVKTLGRHNSVRPFGTLYRHAEEISRGTLLALAEICSFALPDLAQAALVNFWINKDKDLLPALTVVLALRSKDDRKLYLHDLLVGTQEVSTSNFSSLLQALAKEGEIHVVSDLRIKMERLNGRFKEQASEAADVILSRHAGFELSEVISLGTKPFDQVTINEVSDFLPLKCSYRVEIPKSLENNFSCLEDNGSWQIIRHDRYYRSGTFIRAATGEISRIK